MSRRTGSHARGSVTAELALAMPALIVCLSAVLGVGRVVIAQVQCLDAARAAARAAARGDAPAEAVAAGAAVAPDGGHVALRRSPSTVTARVSAPVRLPLPGSASVVVTGTAHAQSERSADPDGGDGG